MAVPKERLLARLKAFLTTKAINNLSTVRLDEFSARLSAIPADDADDAAIDEVITNADTMFPFKDIASNDDRVRTLEAQAKKAETKTPEEIAAEAKAKADAEAAKAKADAETPEWAKALIASNEKLNTEISELKAGKVTETKQAQARTAFEKSEKFKNLPESVKNGYFARIALESETSFEDQVTGLEGEYDAMLQHLADNGQYSGAPNKTTVPATIPEAELEQLASRLGV